MIEHCEGSAYFFSKLFSVSPTSFFVKEIVEKKAFTTQLALFSHASEIEILENPEWVEKVSEIQVDFAALFSVPSHKKVALYESYYRDEIQIGFGDWKDFSKESVERGMKGFNVGPSSSKVKLLYRLEGFDVDQNLHDLPDHIGCELEFLGYLLKSRKKHKAASFLKEHLEVWGSIFAQQVLNSARTDFYRNAASLFKTFLEASLTMIF